MEKRKRVIF